MKNPGRRNSVRNVTASRVRVAVRVRPPPSEPKESISCTLHVDTENNTVQYQQDTQKKTFTFDHVFPIDSTQEDVYTTALQPMLSSFLNGFNVTVLAYGQTGSGKTYTMGNKTSITPCSSPSKQPGRNYSDGTKVHRIGSEDGLIPRFICDLFAALRKEPSVKTLHVSFLEIYCDEIRDLLSSRTNPKDKPLIIREDDHKVSVENLCQFQVETAEKALEWMNMGRLRQVTGATALNDQSSRSHAVYAIEVARKFANEIKKAKLTFVDLAGSERLKKTQVEGVQQKESIQINVGLLALGNVINALGDNRVAQTRRNSIDGANPSPTTFIPYRSSKLTRLLRDALGGNSMTLFIACVSPANIHGGETLNTLQYANRARNIQNKTERNVETEGGTGSPRNAGSPRNGKLLTRTASEIEINLLNEQILWLKQELDEAKMALKEPVASYTHTTKAVNAIIQPTKIARYKISKPVDVGATNELELLEIPMVEVTKVSNTKATNISVHSPELLSESGKMVDRIAKTSSAFEDVSLTEPEYAEVPADQPGSIMEHLGVKLPIGGGENVGSDTVHRELDLFQVDNNDADIYASGFAPDVDQESPPQPILADTSSQTDEVGTHVYKLMQSVQPLDSGYEQNPDRNDMVNTVQFDVVVMDLLSEIVKESHQETAVQHEMGTQTENSQVKEIEPQLFADRYTQTDHVKMHLDTSDQYTQAPPSPSNHNKPEEPDFQLNRAALMLLQRKPSISPRAHRRHSRTPSKHHQYQPMKLFPLGAQWDDCARPSVISQLEAIVQRTGELLADDLETVKLHDILNTAPPTVESLIGNLNDILNTRLRAKTHIAKLQRQLHQFKTILDLPHLIIDRRTLEMYSLSHQQTMLREYIDGCETLAAERLLRRLQHREFAVANGYRSAENENSIFLTQKQYEICLEWQMRLTDREVFQQHLLPFLLNGYISITATDLEREQEWLTL